MRASAASSAPERGAGGFRARLWLGPLRAAPGAPPYWYSPALQRAAREVPAMPWGGFLCEEMGLGKTVEVLALCLAAPAPRAAGGGGGGDGGGGGGDAEEDVDMEAEAEEGGGARPPAALVPAQFSFGRQGPGSAGVAPDSVPLLRSRGTLVVCAVSLVGQWVEEVCRSRHNNKLFSGLKRRRRPPRRRHPPTSSATSPTTHSEIIISPAKNHDTPLEPGRMAHLQVRFLAACPP